MRKIVGLHTADAELVATDTAPLQIPYPIKMPYLRGVNRLPSTGPAMVARFRPCDWELVKEEAHQAGLSPTTFMRWAVLYMAKALRERRTGEQVNVLP